jgi:aldose 1-epimerase
MFSSTLQNALSVLALIFGPLTCQAAAGAMDYRSDLTDKSAAAPSVTKEPFGTMPDGTPVDKYTLTNVDGVSVGILTYGGIVQSIKVRGKNGNLEDIALGFDQLAKWVSREIWM